MNEKIELKAAKYPIDYDLVKKGDLFTIEELEKILSRRRDHKQFPFYLMGFAKNIEREMASRGQVVTVAQVNGSLKVLTDQEASIYNHDMFARNIRGLIHCHQRALGVDVVDFKEDERKTHDRMLEVQGKTLQAVSRVRIELPTWPHRRLLPGVPEFKEQ